MLLVIKKILHYLVSVINGLFIGLTNPLLSKKELVCYLSWIGLEKDNKGLIKKSIVKKSRIYVKGDENEIYISNSLLTDSSIVVTGKHNRVEILEGTELNNVRIIVRGTNCLVHIGKNTTFGGARLINVGRDNQLVIGESCLFSDQIEVWASDTHAIYNESGEWINPEKSIHISNKVWVGSQVTILKGVNIGEGAIIGMRALVTKNVEKRTLVAGSPASVLRRDVEWSLTYPSEI